MACPPLDQSAGFLSGVLRFVDCEAQSIGESGYQALAAPGSSFSMVLTGLLTLFVAIFGYRMLLGHTPNARDAVLALVKIGFVLALATSWPAYRTLIYDVAMRGPAELAAQIGTPAGLPGAGGGMVARLEYADRAMVALAVAGTGQRPPEEASAAARPQVAPPIFGGFDAFALGSARALFLIGIIGAFAAVRIVAGLLLAVAPFFIAFLLFDATRGLFEGWLRVLGGAALGALGSAIVLGVELALVEPWLTALLAARAGGLSIPNAPVELLVTTFLFCLVLAAMLFATARIAMGFRLAPVWRVVSAALPFAARGPDQTVIGTTRTSAPDEGRSRAAALVDAVSASQRREAAQALGGVVANPQPRAPSQQVLRTIEVPTMQPLGQSFRRRTGTRASASATRRDRTP